MKLDIITQFIGHLYLKRLYRVLIFYGEIIGLVERKPAAVVGDGQKTVDELMTEQNHHREKLNKIHGCRLSPLKINPDYRMQWQSLGITNESVVKKGQEIRLANVCNAKYGGSFKTLPIEKLSAHNQKLLVSAAKTINLNLVGFDIVCDDLARPFEKSNGYFLEANYTPDITLHDTPMCGNPRPVSKIIMKQLIKFHPVRARLERFLPK